MSGIIAVYALVVSVLIAGNMKPPPQQQYALFNGFLHLGAGLSVGLTGLAAGYAIGVVGDQVRPPYGLGTLLTATGRSSIHAAVKDLRRHGPNTHFWRSTGPLW